MERGITLERGVSNRIKKINMGLALSPSPSQYNMKSEFDPNKSSKAFSFGIAREAYTKVYIKEQPPPDKSIPGPGQYSIPPIVGDQAVKYSLRPRTVNPCKFSQNLLFLQLHHSHFHLSNLEMQTTIRFNPGPGAYEPRPTLNDKGSYFVSKFKNSLATTIGPPRSKRFKEEYGS